METISWEDFEKVEFRTWTIIKVKDFPEAKNPAYKIWVDFWKKIWIKKTSAQITSLYRKEKLIWKQIIWVINLRPKQIWPFISEFLLTWFYTDSWVILSAVDKKVDNWLKLL